jgi:Uncharacterized small protein
MAKFKPGDKVQLNVGGPAMSVVQYHVGGSVQCTWFAGKKHESGNFAEATLIEYVEGKKKTLGDDL